MGRLTSADDKPLPAKPKKSPKQQQQQHNKNNKNNKKKQSSSWDQFKNLLTCKQIEAPHDPSKPNSKTTVLRSTTSTCGSICSFRDVVHGNTRVVHRADNSPESSSLGQDARLLTRPNHIRPATGPRSNNATSSRGMPLRKLSGCYECRMIDPSRYPIAPRATLCPCSQCGEVFPKLESLEHHQAIRHAVSELGPEDSGRNIVEIIFKSSWMRKDSTVVCKIDRILKVHNTQRTLQRFEDCRDAVKLRANSNATKKNPRCAADGNELLRFHCTTLSCSLGSRGSSSLCSLVPGCGVCTLIRHGFQGSKEVRTTGSSGRAHDTLECTDGRRAMLVCRVIAGRVKPAPEDEQALSPAEHAVSVPPTSYDSVAGSSGAYSNLEDLVVYNPRAILPCFVVIYKTISFN